jgi:hypothetical protein
VFHLIHDIGNVDRVVLIVYGENSLIPRLRLPLWLYDQYLPGVIPVSLGRFLTGIPAILDLCGGSRRVFGLDWTCRSTILTCTCRTRPPMTTTVAARTLTS